MVVLMDPMEDPDDVLRAHRSREKSYLFDVAFDFTATQVREGLGLGTYRSLSPTLFSLPSPPTQDRARRGPATDPQPSLHCSLSGFPLSRGPMRTNVPVPAWLAPSLLHQHI